jgi:hypothetical protein
MLKEALVKLQAEVTAAKNKVYVAPVAAYMMEHVRNHPKDAAKVLVEGKTMAGAIAAMKAEAQKGQAGGEGYITDEQGFAIVLDYYGIAALKAAPIVPVAVAPTPAINVNLDDLF